MVKRKIVDVSASVLLILFALFIVSPVLIVAIRAFSEGVQPFVDFYVWKPTYLRGLSNSLVISLSASLGTVVVSVLAAYVFAKVKFKGRSVIFYLYIIVMMMPFQVTLLPQYIVSRRFALYDTPWAMILPGIFAPFAAFLLTQVMKSVPDELIEAARLDTGSTLKIIWHIIVPTIRPGIICAWVLSFTEQWNAVAEPIIAELSKGKTLILITHRLGSVAIADRILVMDHGEIAESGTHEELLNLGGKYAQMWYAQAESYVEN